MKRTGIHVLVLGALAALSLAGSAQAAQTTVPAQPGDVAGTLSINDGTIMVSNGGAFVSARPGQPIRLGDRLMVTTDSSVAVVYPGGCAKRFDRPGVYTITADCDPNAVFEHTGPSPATLTAISAGAVIAGIVIASDSGSGSSPISR